MFEGLFEHSRENIPIERNTKKVQEIGVHFYASWILSVAPQTSSCMTKKCKLIFVSG